MSSVGKGSSLPGAHLTHREREILLLVLEGKTARQVAAELSISVGTAKNSLTSIYRKLGVSGRAELRITA
jgi:DNA-binding CsgD family transcriptional regulator